MKLRYLYIFIGILFTSCQKAPVNDKLEGMWKAQKIELASGEYIKPDSLYMSFQLNVMQLRIANPKNNNVLGELGYYRITADSLYIQMKTSLEYLKLWGFSNRDEQFAIENFSTNNLVFYNNQGRWSFRKF